MKHTILFLFGLLLSLFSAHAYHFRSYQVEDGLSHNSVWAVMQDSKGFMWFGTNDGLNRFDDISIWTKIRKTTSVSMPLWKIPPEISGWHVTDTVYMF